MKKKLRRTFSRLVAPAKMVDGKVDEGKILFQTAILRSLAAARWFGGGGNLLTNSTRYSD